MKTKNFERKNYVRRAYCKCGSEFVYDTGALFTDLFTNKDKFEHTCRNCGKVESLETRYPEEYWIEEEVK